MSVDPVANTKVTVAGDVVAETTREYGVHAQRLYDRYEVFIKDVQETCRQAGARGRARRRRVQ